MFLKWAEQILVVAWFEIRKFRAGRKWFFPILLAAAPVCLVTLLLLFDPRPPDNSEITQIFAVMFQTFMLRLMVLFGCALVFANLYRGDMVTRTIHFYLLAPVRREVLVAGKYLAGLLITSVFYGGSVGITNTLIHSANGSVVANAHFFAGPGMRELFSYVGIAVLGCVGWFRLHGDWISVQKPSHSCGVPAALGIGERISTGSAAKNQRRALPAIDRSGPHPTRPFRSDYGAIFRFRICQRLSRFYGSRVDR